MSIALTAILSLLAMICVPMAVATANEQNHATAQVFSVMAILFWIATIAVAAVR